MIKSKTSRIFLVKEKGYAKFDKFRIQFNPDPILMSYKDEYIFFHTSYNLILLPMDINSFSLHKTVKNPIKGANKGSTHEN